MIIFVGQFWKLISQNGDHQVGKLENRNGDWKYSNITWIIPKYVIGIVKVNGTNDVMDLMDNETNQVGLRTMTSKKQCWAIEKIHYPVTEWFKIRKSSCSINEDEQRESLYLTAKSSKYLTIEGMFEL